MDGHIETWEDHLFPPLHKLSWQIEEELISNKWWFSLSALENTKADNVSSKSKEMRINIRRKKAAQRKSVFFLRKLNLKLKPCNHHIKGLPFFQQPLVCSLDAREVFSIRFLCFFSGSGKLTHNRLNTRCSLERSAAANCVYQKHSLGLFTLYDLIKKISCWECFCDFRRVRPKYRHTDDPRRITFICLAHFCGQFVFCCSPDENVVTQAHSWILLR